MRAEGPGQFQGKQTSTVSGQNGPVLFQGKWTSTTVSGQKGQYSVRAKGSVLCQGKWPLQH